MHHVAFCLVRASHETGNEVEKELFDCMTSFGGRDAFAGA